jgi:hypothetical protein
MLGVEQVPLPIYVYSFLPVTAQRNRTEGLQRMNLAGSSRALEPDQ